MRFISNNYSSLLIASICIYMYLINPDRFDKRNGVLIKKNSCFIRFEFFFNILTIYTKAKYRYFNNVCENCLKKIKLLV